MAQQLEFIDITRDLDLQVVAHRAYAQHFMAHHLQDRVLIHAIHPAIKQGGRFRHVLGQPARGM